jgi:Yip1-like protein
MEGRRQVNVMSLQTRVVNIITKPESEWRTIAGESADVAGLFRDYAVPLSAIPAFCRFVGMSVVGVSVPFLGTVRTDVVRSLAGAIVSWVLSLVGTWLAGLIVEKLAPTFQSRSDPVQALKLVIYAMTPVWVAGVLNLVPALGILVILAALYSIYLFYLGLPPVMGTPPDKVIPYMAVSAVVVIVVSIVLGMITAAAVGVGGYGL